MTDIKELLAVVHEMYRRADAAGEDMAGKSCEGMVSVTYPTWWDVQDGADPTTPMAIHVYSYLFGPSRQHYFGLADNERTVNYYTWESPDPVATAIRVITTEWAPQYFADVVKS